jgi:hypothetical protein
MDVFLPGKNIATIHRPRSEIQAALRTGARAKTDPPQP